MAIKIGDDTKMELWTDPWIPGYPNPSLVALHGAHTNHNMRVADLILQDLRRWNMDI